MLYSCAHFEKLQGWKGEGPGGGEEGSSGSYLRSSWKRQFFVCGGGIGQVVWLVCFSAYR